MITKIIKRDGREANFDTEKITQAIYKAAQAIGGNDYDAAKALSVQVRDLLEKKCGDKAPTVEQVQDAVERCLLKTVMQELQRNIYFTVQSVQECVK